MAGHLGGKGEIIEWDVINRKKGEGQKIKKKTEREIKLSKKKEREREEKGTEKRKTLLPTNNHW